MSMVFNMVGGGGGSKPKKLLSSLTEGSLVSVLEDGKLVPFYVAKHNYEADLNGEGRTLLVRKECYDTRFFSQVNNVYSTSDIDAFLSNNYPAKLSAVVQGNLGLMNIECTGGVQSAAVITLQRKAFILSLTELGLSNASVSVLGESLPITGLLRIATIDGTATTQWTRSPMNNSSVQFVSLNASGVQEATVCDQHRGFRPCFTLPSAMMLNTEPYADGSWGLADEDVMIDTETVTTAAKLGVTYTNGIADLTPVQLNEIAAAISANPNINKDTSIVYYDKGTVHRKISVGDTHEISFSGTAYVSRVSGFNHYDLSFGTVYGSPTATGKVGILLEMVDCLAGTFQMNTSNTNSGGWASCYLRNSIVPALLEQIPSELLSAMKTVNILTSVGSKSSTVNVTKDNLFAPSEVEVYGKATYSAAGEGEQYAYYKAGNSKVKKRNGNADFWWERSPRNADTTSFCIVNTDGSTGTTGASSSHCVAFAYCI